MKLSCSDTLTPYVPGVNQQGAHEEAAAPSPNIPRPDCSMGFPGLEVAGGRQQGLPEEEPLICSVQVLSPPGLACSLSRVTHPEFEGLETWDGRQWGTLEDHHPCRGPRPWGPRWKGAHPLVTKSRTAKSGCSTGTPSWDGEELLGKFLWSLELGPGGLQEPLPV